MSDRGLVSRWISWAPYLLSVLRLVSAFLFIQYGTTKLFGFPAEVMPGGGTAAPLSLAGIAALFCFLWLYISAAGPGPWSIDAALRGRKVGPPG